MFDGLCGEWMEAVSGDIMKLKERVGALEHQSHPEPQPIGNNATSPVSLPDTDAIVKQWCSRCSKANCFGCIKSIGYVCLKPTNFIPEASTGFEPIDNDSTIDESERFLLVGHQCAIPWYENGRLRGGKVLEITEKGIAKVQFDDSLAFTYWPIDGLTFPIGKDKNNTPIYEGDVISAQGLCIPLLRCGCGQLCLQLGSGAEFWVKTDKAILYSCGPNNPNRKESTS